MTDQPGLLLEVDGLSLSYLTRHGEIQAVREVSFELARGRALGLVGESGCGKTSVARCLMRLLPDNAQLSAGRVLLDVFLPIGLLIVVAKLLESGKSDREIYDHVFMSAYSRKATDREWNLASNYVASMGSQGVERKQILDDLLWTVINSQEFLVNH